MTNKRNSNAKRLLNIGVCLALVGSVTVAFADGDKRGHAHGAEHDADGRFEFGLWGDTPYAKNGDEVKIPALIASMNSERLAFSIFDGDTKDGSSKCEDIVIGANATARFNSLKAPVVYVPGDNEWTDCHRINNGGYNALGRLNFLRQNMFATNQSFGEHKMTLKQQGAPGESYSENTRWLHENVVFVGLNVPGSNNNKVNAADCLSSKSARTQTDCDADNAEYTERNAKNLSWLTEAFDIAKQRQSPGVMIVIQGDPGFDLPETETLNERLIPGYDGYNDLVSALVTHSKGYAGQVVLVHGDTHFFKVDKPLIDQAHLVKNFTRVETFGSPNVHWIKVKVDPRNPNVFEFEPVIVATN